MRRFGWPQTRLEVNVDERDARANLLRSEESDDRREREKSARNMKKKRRRYGWIVMNSLGMVTQSVERVGKRRRRHEAATTSGVAVFRRRFAEDGRLAVVCIIAICSCARAVCLFVGC